MKTLFIISLVLGCFVVTTNGRRCPSCTYLTTNADIHSLDNTVNDGAPSLFTDVKCSKKISGSITEVGEETCPVKLGIVSKCSFYNGSLTLRVPFIGAEITFKTYQRGCLSTLSANGCYDRDNENEDKIYFRQILDSAGRNVSILDVVGFKGNLCLTNSSSALVAVKCRLLFISSFFTLIVLRLL